MMGDLVNAEPDKEQSKALSTVMAALDWAYDRAIHGIPGFDDPFTEPVGTSDEAAVDALIRRHVREASAAGFLANLGGLLTLPISIPANLGSVLYIQLRMITGVAHLRGYDVRSAQVKALAIACLGGSAAMDMVKDAGITLGNRLTQRAITHVSTATISRLDRVGFLLLRRAATGGAFTLSRFVPFVGGAVGGAIDGLTTKAIGAAAKRVFKPSKPSD